MTLTTPARRHAPIRMEPSTPDDFWGPMSFGDGGGAPSPAPLTGAVRRRQPVRLETFDEDWATISARLTLRDSAAVKRAISKRSNTKKHGAVELYAEAFKGSPSMCIFCSIYAQDYACFGYDGMCAQTLSQLDRAGALD